MSKSLLLLLATSALFACARHGAGDDPDPDAGGLIQNDQGAAACMAAVQQSSSVGCEYYAVHMDGHFGANNGCFVSFLANTSQQSVHVKASFAGGDVDLAGHAAIPRGTGKNITYEELDLAAGIPPGEVAILFLAGIPQAGAPMDGNVTPDSSVPCPMIPAMSSLTQLHGTGRSYAFRLKTDAPVVAYQMLPYGGGNAAVTGATLLLPTSAYGTNYIAVDAYGASNVPGTNISSMDIVAAQDDTTVTLNPIVDVNPGVGVASAKKGSSVSYTLKAGEVLQFTQSTELTGSPILADKPITLFAGHPCANVPTTYPFCDHAEQQIPPVQALGSEYMAVGYRQRRDDKTENPPYRIIGAVDGTTLSYSRAVGGPSTLAKGEVVEFQTGLPYAVRSQDKDHPFLLIGSMSGATMVGGDGYGDSDIVRVVPTGQWLDRYVFFTDPTYPETNLVVTRTKEDGGYADVTLDCAGVLGGWQDIDATHQYTRIDLVRHDFQPQGGCDNGRHEMSSMHTFGLTVWGWGTPETSTYTGYVSYGYPAGENVKKLNDVIVPP